ncbi:uncharacterized protein E0L32_006270 [Thyridium curvatum]|uniref:Uncharacterized protein n=1 Tax=Thyridium curvatum TaxID=1093900 RepID=A0A507B0P4_9PEZI|nr:uncharacterized protein E0L32_006270 [Thyridium curvatum]TPX13297.1 hypothetical protein E0L32_006270 [Thyridium curvatum]
MAQGTIKQKANKAGTGPKKTTQQTQLKKGTRVFKSKKGKSNADKVMKKFTSGMAAQTEALLGERAGHLELIGKGKKGKKDDANKKKGGSKKFG